MVVYRRTNTRNGKVYIGKTTRTAEERWVSMLYEVRRGGNSLIHNAIRKHGAEAFVTDILHETDSYEDLSAMETFFILQHRSHERSHGYNLTLGGDGAAPGELNFMWGKTHTDEVKAKIRTFRLGRKQTEETKRKISDASRGEKNGFYGRTHTSERALEGCRKGGLSHLGKKRDPEVGRKISKALTGIVRSEETRKRVSQAKKGQGLGRKHTPEAIKRMREVKRQWWAQRKEALKNSVLLP